VKNGVDAVILNKGQGDRIRKTGCVMCKFRNDISKNNNTCSITGGSIEEYCTISNRLFRTRPYNCPVKKVSVVDD